MPAPEVSMRHPQVSLEDTIAMKLGVLAEMVHATDHDRRGLAREIVTDIKSLIRQETARG